MKKDGLRSNCPINYALEFLGDKWTLLIIRDMVFDGKTFYKEFLASEEKIATNILSDRLKRLEKLEIIKSSVYEKQKTQKVYTLTQKGIDLVPLLIELIGWSGKYKVGLNVEPEFLRKLDHNKSTIIKDIQSSISNNTST